MNLKEIADLLRPLAHDRDYRRRTPNFAWRIVQAIDAGTPLNPGAYVSIVSVISDHYDDRTISLVKKFFKL